MNEPLVSIIIPVYNKEKDLMRLLNSILENNYKNIEIIVVDDASPNKISLKIKKFQNLKLLRNEREKLVAGSRNVGIKNATGDLFFLMDSDNIIARNTISELVRAISSHSNIGIACPLTYYFKDPKRIWWAGTARSKVTSFTKSIGKDKLDTNQFKDLIRSESFRNALMIKKEIIQEVGLFDEKNFPIHYEEADFSERIKKRGFEIVVVPTTKIWHDIPLPEEVEDKARLFHCHNELRAYYCGRNRIIFHKIYSKKWGYLIFISSFLWIFTTYYLKVILVNSNKPLKERLKVIKAYLRGTLDGLRWKK